MENKDEDLNHAVQEYITLCATAAETVRALQTRDWSEAGLKQYCSENGIEYIEDRSDQSNATMAKLRAFDYSSLLDRFDRASAFGIQVQTDIGHRSYNQPYLTHLRQQINGVITRIQAFNKSMVPSRENDSGFPVSLQNHLDSKLKSLTGIEQSINPNLNELYEHFKYGDKNYVIFGKNGAGKTTLLHKIAADILSDNSVIIPADRTITIQTSSYYSFNRDFSLNQKLSDKDAIEYLLSEMESKDANNYYHSQIPLESSVEKRLCTIFDELGMERYLSTNRREAYLSVTVNGGQIYPLADGSDGERTVVYMILAVLLSPTNAYIFIDEPENHLNGLLMRNLFDSLERTRPDVRFIYLTHKTDFIESRGNIELIYLSKTDKHNEWSFKKLSDYEHIDLDIILGIEGAQNDIIFCEGNNTSSIDSKLLNAIYPEYTIKPVASCNNVKENTIAINSAPELFRRKATGLVDGDFQTDEEQQALTRNGVQVLPYNEWENLLLDLDVLLAVNQDIDIADTNQIVAHLIEVIKTRKTNVLNDFLNKRFLRILATNKLSVDSELENQIDHAAVSNKQKILAEIDSLSEQFDSYVQNRQYNGLIGIIPGKMFINEAALQLGLRNATAYVNKVLAKAALDASFRKLLKQKISLHN
jgi:ABC-type cobalamin/Fe3+-siderophores transport system ATPase subunit